MPRVLCFLRCFQCIIVVKLHHDNHYDMLLDVLPLAHAASNSEGHSSNATLVQGTLQNLLAASGDPIVRGLAGDLPQKILEGKTDSDSLGHVHHLAKWKQWADTIPEKWVFPMKPHRNIPIVQNFNLGPLHLYSSTLTTCPTSIIVVIRSLKWPTALTRFYFRTINKPPMFVFKQRAKQKFWFA